MVITIKILLNVTSPPSKIFWSLRWCHSKASQSLALSCLFSSILRWMTGYSKAQHYWHFVTKIHWWLMDSPTWIAFPCDDAIMYCMQYSWHGQTYIMLWFLNRDPIIDHQWWNMACLNCQVEKVERFLTWKKDNHLYNILYIEIWYHSIWRYCLEK